MFATKTPGSGRTRRGESFLRIAASPDTTPTGTPSQAWDCGTRSGTRPGKTGFLSHSLLTEQHTCPRVSHEKNLRRFSVQGEAGERKKKPLKDQRDGREKQYGSAWENWRRVQGGVGGGSDSRQTLGRIKLELHEKNG